MARQHRRKGTLSGVLALMPLAIMSHGVTVAQVPSGPAFAEAATATMAQVPSVPAFAEGATAAAAQAESSPAQAAAPVAVAAVWKTQEISFYFTSFSTFYPCPSLNDKVRRLLVQLGAHRDIRVRSSGCDMGYAVARSPMVRIRLSAPAEATPEMLAELEKNRTTRELIARVRGESGQDGAAQFPAYWQRISLARAARHLDSGDCDLVNAIKRQVLPQLSVRIVRDDMRCSPYQYSSGPVLLEVEALMAMPAAGPDAVAKQTALRREES